jgi:hypothetical protein
MCALVWKRYLPLPWDSNIDILKTSNRREKFPANSLDDGEEPKEGCCVRDEPADDRVRIVEGLIIAVMVDIQKYRFLY